jgi:hypothetical protein
MKSRTLCFPPGRIAPGMTLAKAITDRDGNTLLTAGTVLNLEMLDRLIRRGIETVSVLLLDTRDEETIAEELRAAQSRVEAIFRGDGSHARAELRDSILNFRLESTQ